MFQTTTTENFQSWDRFLGAYYEPIRTALGMMPFVGPDRADDVTHDFFLKLYERDLLANRPEIRGRFRDWLYVAARHFALDDWRRRHRRREHEGAFGALEAVAPQAGGRGDEPFDADECYALSVLHLTVSRVRQHLLREGKGEHWMIFEELVLAPLVPGRSAKSREELLAMFPGQGPAFLDNRMTTVKRVFRRILPALIPVDPTEERTAEERFGELLGILRGSARTRLWLAFLLDPAPAPEVPVDSSIDLAIGSIGGEGLDASAAAEVLHDELRVLLGFWLEMPLAEYLDGPEAVSLAIAAAIRRSRLPGAVANGRRLGPGPDAPPPSLRRLVDEAGPVDGPAAAQLTALLERVKSFAKGVHRLRSRPSADRGAAGPIVGRLADSMPFEIAQVVYNLAGALAMTRCGARIVGLDDQQYRKNLTWVLKQSWLDPTLRPVFSEAARRLGPGAGG